MIVVEQRISAAISFDVVDARIDISFIFRIAIDDLDVLLDRGSVVFKSRESLDHLLPQFGNLRVDRFYV